MTTYTFTTLDDPSAVVGPNSGNTSAFGINNLGQVVGLYSVANNGGTYGFVERGGNYTTVDDPSTSTASLQDHWSPAMGINDLGLIVGQYDYFSDFTGTQHGFLDNHSSYGDIIDPAEGSGGSTSAFGINDHGDIVGSYNNPSIGGYLGFIESKGHYTTLADPSSYVGGATVATGINNLGTVVGFYSLESGGDLGFTYSHGHYTTLDDPLSTGAAAPTPTASTIPARWSAITRVTTAYTASSRRTACTRPSMIHRAAAPVCSALTTSVRSSATTSTPPGPSTASLLRPIRDGGCNFRPLLSPR